TRWKIAIEAGGMVAFITWVLWHTDGLASPLLNAYLLPVITSALTLGKVATLLTVALIAACYLLLGGSLAPDLISLPYVGALIAQLAPVLLVAYITTMFSADIRYGLARAQVRAASDEFIVLLPDTPAKGALEVAERIRNRIAGAPVRIDSRELVTSVSIGIACYPEDGATLDALAAHADGALYSAKQDGRNRTVKFRA